MLNKLAKLRIPWLVLILAMTGFLAYHAVVGFPVETNILKLLPETRTDPITEQAYRQFELATGRKTVFMIGAEDLQEAKKGAEVLYERMVESELFAEISYRIDSDRARKTYETYDPHRQSLLSEEQREFLKSGHPELLVSQATKTLMSPVSMGASAGIGKDPLFTFVEFLKSLQSQAGAFSIDEDLLVADHEDKRYVVVIALLKDDAFSVAAQDRFDAFYKSAKRDVQSAGEDIELVSAGVIHHAVAGTGSARADISTIGVGSWVGSLLLVIAAFGSLYPLITSSLPVLAGFIAGIAVCILLFGKIHLFTLVFGSSLVGIAIDYAFHYMCEQVGAGESWDPQHGLESIFSSVTLGIVANATAYLTLALTPFTGLQQVAVFNSVGLIAAYLTVVLWFPVLHRKSIKERSPITLKWSRFFVRMWGNKRPKSFYPIFAGISLALAVYIALNLKTNDDIRALQNSPPQVVQEENLIKEIVGSSSGTQFFVVQGDSENSVLTAEEALTTRLDKEIEAGHLRRYHAISKVLPSPSRQQENYELLRDQALDEDSVVSQYFKDMEFEDAVVSNYRESFQTPTHAPLSAEELLKSPLRELYQQLWIAHPEQKVFAGIVVLDGVKNLEAMRNVADKSERARFVSRADDVSALLKTFRILGSWLVFGAICVVLSFLIYRYRARHGLGIIVAPVGACLSAIAVSVALGISLNLFNTLALMIVLGLGIDYTIFFAEKDSDREITMHAVFLSGITNILSFGLLALSGTPVIRSFGLTVFVGIAVSLILAPIVGMDEQT